MKKKCPGLISTFSLLLRTIFILLALSSWWFSLPGLYCGVEREREKEELAWGEGARAWCAGFFIYRFILFSGQNSNKYSFPDTPPPWLCFFLFFLPSLGSFSSFLSYLSCCLNVLEVLWFFFFWSIFFFYFFWSWCVPCVALLVWQVWQACSLTFFFFSPLSSSCVRMCWGVGGSTLAPWLWLPLCIYYM